MELKTIIDLEKELEEIKKHSEKENPLQETIDKIAISEREAQIEQTKAICDVILDSENDLGLKVKQDTRDKQKIDAIELLNKIKGKEKK